MAELRPGEWFTHGERFVYESEWMSMALVDVETPSGHRFEHHAVGVGENGRDLAEYAAHEILGGVGGRLATEDPANQRGRLLDQAADALEESLQSSCSCLGGGCIRHELISTEGILDLCWIGGALRCLFVAVCFVWWSRRLFDF